jgi:hypothetical protein
MKSLNGNLLHQASSRPRERRCVELSSDEEKCPLTRSVEPHGSTMRGRPGLILCAAEQYAVSFLLSKIERQKNTLH